MKYFTSDWHLNDDRIGINGKPNLFYRNFRSVDEQNAAMFNSVYGSKMSPGDTLYHLGDVVYRTDDKVESLLSDMYNRCVFFGVRLVLIVGNYDEDKIDMLSKYFDEIHTDLFINIDGIGKCYLNHYPTKTLESMGDASLGITGHIHSLWKVQRGLINVGVDAWQNRIVSEEEIKFCYNAMEHHYDNDVFPYSPK